MALDCVDLRARSAIETRREADNCHGRDLRGNFLADRFNDLLFYDLGYKRFCAVTLAYGAACNGRPCALDPGYFAGYRLRAVGRVRRQP